MRDTQDCVDWKKILFTNYARPRATFTLWLALQNILPMKDRLTKFGMIAETCYSFCDQPKNASHLFFECKFTNSIWKVVLNWMGYHRQPLEWEQENQWLILETKKKGWRRNLLKLGLAKTIYGVWTAGNKLVFTEASGPKLEWQQCFYNW